MINGDAGKFVEELACQDHYALFQSKILFFNACQCRFNESGKMISAALEVYNLTDNTVLFSTEQDNCSRCIEQFENAAIFNGKTFWQVEQDIEWVDC